MTANIRSMSRPAEVGEEGSHGGGSRELLRFVLTQPRVFLSVHAMAKPALGRGLSALLGGMSPAQRPTAISVPPTPAKPTDPSSAPTSGVLHVAIDRVVPCPFQPRKSFPTEAQSELADSIRTQGIIQPLIVRARGNQYEIIAGERRWRAAQVVGLTELPVILREADDRSVLELALIENLQRENLNPIEEALGYAELIERFQLKQEEAALKVGKSRVAVANALRLLRLPAELKDALREGKLSVGHAKVLLGLPTEAAQASAAHQVMQKGMTVRQTEALVSSRLTPSTSTDSPAAPAAVTVPRDPNVAAVETKLRERFATKVNLKYAKGRGAIEIRFFSDDELQRVLDVLGITMD